MRKKAILKQQQELNYRREVFFKKIEEYEKMTLEELQARFQLPGKKNRIGGIYREAMIEVVRRKQIEQANKVLSEEKSETPVMDNPSTEQSTE
jgi:hypothetical protein